MNHGRVGGPVAVDDQAETVLGCIRTLRADAGSGPLQIGIVHLSGTGPAAILCEGP